MNTSIWFKREIAISDLKPLGPDTMGEHLGIEWVELGNNYIKAKMPVDKRTRQPMVCCMAGHPAH